MVETCRVPIRCPDCKGQLTAVIGPLKPSPTHASIWTCPYCRAAQRTHLGGSLLSVMKRRDDQPEGYVRGG